MRLYFASVNYWWCRVAQVALVRTERLTIHQLSCSAMKLAPSAMNKTKLVSPLCWWRNNLRCRAIARKNLTGSIRERKGEQMNVIAARYAAKRLTNENKRCCCRESFHTHQRGRWCSFQKLAGTGALLHSPAAALAPLERTLSLALIY